MANARKVAIIDGCRIPFQRASTGYNSFTSYDLARLALKGIVGKTLVDTEIIDRVIMGTVISNMTTSNVARDALLGAGLPSKIPANTVTMACISSNVAITSAVDAILSGQAKVVIAGGTDTASDIPIRYRKKFRQKLIETQKYKKPTDYFRFFKGLSWRDFLPEIPGITEFSTGKTMGQSCERLIARFGVTREEQDQYAVLSQQKALAAMRKGFLAEEIIPVAVPPKLELVKSDNGVREDTTIEKLRELKPAFIKTYGTITAGNASFLTDGAAAVLLMEEEFALSLGYKPKAYVRSYAYTGLEPLDELLLGPACSTPKVLDMAGLSLSNIDVLEFHEAFAGQIVASIKALASDAFAKERLGKSEKIGDINMDKFNAWGGSLSIGHPFGATGARLVTTAANRLHKENGQFALVAACAAGALGSAIILERAR